jgi:hypothetical protein
MDDTNTVGRGSVSGSSSDKRCGRIEPQAKNTVTTTEHRLAAQPPQLSLGGGVQSLGLDAFPPVES